MQHTISPSLGWDDPTPTQVCRAATLARHLRYNASEKGRARNARYESSPRGRARKYLYEATVRAWWRAPGGPFQDCQRATGDVFNPPVLPFTGFLSLRPGWFGEGIPRWYWPDQEKVRWNYLQQIRHERATSLLSPITFGALSQTTQEDA